MRQPLAMDKTAPASILVTGRPWSAGSVGAIQAGMGWAMATKPTDTEPAEVFEISGADVKSRDRKALDDAGATPVRVRGHAVLLAADVALIFGVETREIVQNIKSNPDIFPEKYAFELDHAEVASLRSAGLIAKAGRGGSRALPWVVTRKGAIRLATIMRSPRAIQAADIFVDIFDTIVEQLQSGSNQVAIANPSQVVPTGNDRKVLTAVRDQLADAMKALFNTVIDTGRNTTVADELGEVSAEAVNHVKAWLRGRALANEKLEAETMLIVEQVRDMYERRQADLADKSLERERKALENVRVRMAVAQEMLAMYQKLEPSALVRLTGSFAPAAAVLQAPATPALLDKPKK